MKKIVYTLAIFMAIGAFKGTSAQSIQTSNETEIINNEEVSLRQNIDRPITQFIVQGKSAVMLAYDTTNYIIAKFQRNESNPLENKWVVVKGMSLIIDDPEGDALYEVHLKKADLQVIKNSLSTPIHYVDLFDRRNAVDSLPTTESTGNLALQQQLDEAQRELNNARDELIEMIPLEPITIDPLEDSTRTNMRSQYYHSSGNPYVWEDRTGAAFLWAFNNWGSNWYNGLNKMDGAYELNTSFSSWQLEFNYSVILKRHFNLDIGIGYESDIYKFTSSMIDIDNSGFFQDNLFFIKNPQFSSTRPNDWSCRLVTRYVSIPIDFVFRINDDFRIGIAAIPALNFTSSPTGLKHKIDTKEFEYLDVENTSKYITPYKLDLRLSMRYNHFGVFAQVSTMSLFTNMDVFPIKIGFILK